MKSANLPQKSESDKVYQKFVKPLEKEYWGKFIAITPEGKFLIESDLVKATAKGIEKLGSGNFLFKIGEKAVGRIG